jgi:hypothetical protein
MSANQARDAGADQCISAMKGRARLAQSLGLQTTEKIGFFNDFSSPPDADSWTS